MKQLWLLIAAVASVSLATFIIGSLTGTVALEKAGLVIGVVGVLLTLVLDHLKKI